MVRGTALIPGFEFAAPERIVFGGGVLRQAGALARGFGRRALVATGSNPERAGRLLELLEAAGVEATVVSAAGEPTVEDARRAAAAARESGAELCVGYGGGSALDLAKAAGALAANGGDPLDYLEVVGGGKPLGKGSLPTIAIPTTAGTGSEATKNAVLASPAHGIKASLRSAAMMPRVALVDPELAASLPPGETAATGLDALTQLIEPFCGLRPNPLADNLCRDGIWRVARSLRRAWADGGDAAAREDMALASLYGGMALANAGLGIVHGIAGPAGGALGAAHGALCAALLPHGMAANRKVLRERRPESGALARYEEVARLLTGDAGATAEDGEEWLLALNAELGIAPLSEWGVGEEEAAELAGKAAAASSTKGNPVELSAEEIAEIILAAAAGG